LTFINVSLNRGEINWQLQEGRTDASNRTQTEDLIGCGSEDYEIDHGNRIVERLADKQLPRCSWCRRVRIHEYAETRLDALIRRWPLSAEEWINGTCWGQTIQPFERVFLNDGTVGRDHGKYCLAGTIWRGAQEGGPHSTLVQRACYDLRLGGHCYDVTVCQAAHVDPADQWVGGASERQPGRIQDRR
jgi:hypothetical protein